MFTKFLTVALLQLSFASEVAAESSAKFAAPAANAAAQDISSGGGVLQIFGSLALVVATILIIGWVARRLRAVPQGRGGRLTVIDEVSIGPKERAVILQVDGIHLVLGVGEGRVSILHRSPAVVDRAEAGASIASKPDQGGRFLDVLKRSLGK